MNKDNLLTCLNTKEHCGEGLIINVQDVTDTITGRHSTYDSPPPNAWHNDPGDI